MIFAVDPYLKKCNPKKDLRLTRWANAYALNRVQNFKKGNAVNIATDKVASELKYKFSAKQLNIYCVNLHHLLAAHMCSAGVSPLIFSYYDFYYKFIHKLQNFMNCLFKAAGFFVRKYVQLSINISKTVSSLRLSATFFAISLVSAMNGDF